MSDCDDLRTSIAWTLYRATQRQPAYVEDIERYPGEPTIDGTITVDGHIDFINLADAVIDELKKLGPGLQPDGSYIDATGTVWRHNGTEWINDPHFRP